MKIKKYEFHHIAMVQKNLNEGNETSQKHIGEKISVVQSSHASSDKKTMMVHPNNASIEINNKNIYIKNQILVANRTMVYSFKFYNIAAIAMSHFFT